MLELKLIKRFDRAVMENSGKFYRNLLKGVKGMRPALCPAIRSFQSLGWRVSPPVNVIFRSERSFDVDRYSDEDGKKFLVPGVIGDKESERLYARIDSGFSLVDLSVPMLAIKCQEEGDYYRGFEVAPVIYPKGYTGPILMAVSANGRFELIRSEYILHLIPMTSEEVDVVVDEDFEHLEPQFEGLFKNSWEVKFISRGRFDSEEILNQ